MKPSPLRIASYNLQKCVGLDLRRKPDRSLAVIAGLGAQIVVLQEADKRLPPRPPALPREMAQAHGWQVAGFGNAGAPLAGSLGFHGNAMLLGPEIHLRESAHIELPGLEPRGAIRAELDTPLGPLRVVGVHLGLIRRHRLMQLGVIVRHLQQLPPAPTVLAGDFNEWGTARALDHVTQGLRLLPDRASFPAPRPVAPLDRFALSSELVAHAHGTHSARPARIASDHLPVWADLILA
ncbi:endonuclease/exonuclease/phosphatase family protein [Aquicoccus sp. G2-2]|uniref:endonuclease/exonuclease/phosphatase family protein n=1 Tax=Aquicoccus sp. G2-2 TaxID=3092120 RepID=UPI002AE021BD|nr:endonuclease/exonuclease/phosphatase family protein [Aquicoccus sp. G2-2]MEA1112830.1 endonuclease/exonuclease/phosphatase family protein [Aquicoccus sp. G2-2]